jgi:outer membrane lipoprotein-sorting protein
MKTKRVTLFLLLIIMAVQGFSQKDPVERIFEKYGGREGYTTVYISSKMFSMFSEADIEDPEFNELMKNLKSIRILAQDEGAGRTEKADFYKEVVSGLSTEEYEELMTVTEPGQKIRFLVKEEKGKISELLMIVGGDSDNVLIDIRGNINMKQISQLSKAIHINGLEKLDELEKK